LTSDKTQPRKWLRRRRCVFWILNILISCGVCYVLMWLFARFGGEWATRYDIPVPGSARLITTKYTSSSYGDYVEKLSLFISQSTPEEIREWFVQSGIGMTPILLDADRNTYIDQPDYYFEPPLYYHQTSFGELHRISAFITAGWWEDFIPHCQRVRIYRNDAAAAVDFPGYIVPEGYTAFMVSTCWPDVI
jgi:hypothetical protein